MKYVIEISCWKFVQWVKFFEKKLKIGEKTSKNVVQVGLPDNVMVESG